MLIFGLILLIEQLVKPAPVFHESELLFQQLPFSFCLLVMDQCI